MDVLDTRIVRIEAEGYGPSPTTWGQRTVWQTFCLMYPDDALSNLGLAWPVPPDRSVADALDAIGWLVARHESLRSTFESHSDSLATQRVEDVANLEVYVVADGPGTKYATIAALAADRFDLTSFPVRFAIGADDHGARWIAGGLSHLAADGMGADVIGADLESFFAGSVLPPAHQPRERAEWESSPSGQAQLERSVLHWRRGADTAATALFADRGGSQPIPSLTVHAKGLGRTARALADAAKVGDAAVFYGGMAVALADITNAPVCAIPVHCSNRVSPELNGYVGSLVQHGLLVVEVAAEVPEQLRRTASSLLQAHRYSRYDPAVRDKVLQEAAEDRGGSAELGHFGNFRPVERALRLPSDVAVADGDAFIQHDPELPSSPKQFAFQFLSDGIDASLNMYVNTRYADEAFVPAVLARLLRFVNEGPSPAQERLEAMAHRTGRR